VEREHNSYYPDKSGLLNGTPDKSSGQHLKLPYSSRHLSPTSRVPLAVHI